MNDNTKPDPTRDTVSPDGVYTRYTLGISAFYLFIVAIVLLGGHVGKAGDMDPNEWGDLLAGIFAPLAWGWLAVGYYLQRLELIEQRNEIRLARLAAQSQANEQRDQAIAMANLVKVTSLQEELARRQFELHEHRIRIGTRPRYSVEQLAATTQELKLRISNSGSATTEVLLALHTADPSDYAIANIEGEPGLFDFANDSSVDVTFRATSNDYDLTHSVLVLSMDLGELSRLDHRFTVHPDGRCTPAGRWVRRVR